MLRILYRYFQTDNSLTQAFDLDSLSNINYVSDEKMEDFYNVWTRTLANMEKSYAHQ